MEHFLKEVIEGKKIEFLVDTNIFSKDIILKSAYGMLEKVYFFFKVDNNGNMIVQMTQKEGEKGDLITMAGEFSDELLSVYLRNKLEIENKNIREKIVSAAISNSLDVQGYVEIDAKNSKQDEPQIDFDKDIDDILREIENDPDLKIDEEEIAKILREIEEENELEEINKEEVKIDLETIKKVKEQFNK